jgi:23S rRNA (pseudouridine1915-N3)-methyltransferase
MLVRLVAVGRLRNAALREVCDAYATRIRRYQKFEIREVKDAGRRAADARAVRRLEADAVTSALAPETTLVALTRGGTQLDSRAFAHQLKRWRYEARDVAFLIGGAWGLDDALLARVHFRLSLSTLTLPHEVARLVLLEQIYRACTILKGEPYHKA